MFNDATPISATSTGIPSKSSTNLPPLPDIPSQTKTNGTSSGQKPVPTPRPRPREKEKKIYVAAYDYKPCEEGDLELITVCNSLIYLVI